MKNIEKLVDKWKREKKIVLMTSGQNFFSFNEGWRVFFRDFREVNGNLIEIEFNIEIEFEFIEIDLKI